MSFDNVNRDQPTPTGAEEMKMSSKFEVVTVRFHQIFPSQDINVPIADAWQFWEDRAAQVMAGGGGSLDGYFKAIVHNTETGEEFETFAKSWTVWDFSRLVHRLARIGLGAYGDGGPRNPDPSVHVRGTQHLVGQPGQQNWCAGINWDSRADIYREGGKECGL